MPHDILPDVTGWQALPVFSLVFTIVLTWVGASVAAEPLAPEVLLLARIRAKAKEGLASVPAYVCAEKIARSERLPSRLFAQKLDELKLEVAEIGGRELYARSGESQFQDKPLVEMVARGLISTGMFYHIAHTVFAGPAAHFEFAGHKRFKGRKAVQYTFTVAPLFAKYRLQSGFHGADCGMKGAFWADETSLDLMRVHIEATEMPPALEIRHAVTDIDYDRTSIGGKSFLIPASSDVAMVLSNGVEDRNQVHFSNCRKYGVESTLSFQ